MLHSNEEGFTLIEILAVLVIGAIIMSLTFNIVSSGMEKSKHIQERALLQNESNYLLVVLSEFHKRGEEYSIIFNDDEMIIEDVNQQHTLVFNNYRYMVNGGTELISISPKNSDKSLRVTFKLISKRYSHIEQITNTILHRL